MKNDNCTELIVPLVSLLENINFEKLSRQQKVDIPQYANC